MPKKLSDSVLTIESVVEKKGQGRVYTVRDQDGKVFTLYEKSFFSFLLPYILSVQSEGIPVTIRRGTP